MIDSVEVVSLQHPWFENKEEIIFLVNNVGLSIVVIVDIDKQTN